MSNVKHSVFDTNRGADKTCRKLILIVGGGKLFWYNHFRMGINEKKLKDILKEQREEFQNHVGALAEHFQSQTQAVAEQYSDIKQTLDSHSKMFVDIKQTLDRHTEILDSHSEMIANLAENMEIVKADIEFIKGGLKKKVDYEEFAALERRLSLLESRVNR